MHVLLQLLWSWHDALCISTSLPCYTAATFHGSPKTSALSLLMLLVSPLLEAYTGMM